MNHQHKRSLIAFLKNTFTAVVCLSCILFGGSSNAAAARLHASAAFSLKENKVNYKTDNSRTTANLADKTSLLAAAFSPEEVLGTPAGTVFSTDQILPEDLPKCFSSREICEGDEVYRRISGKSYQENENIQLSDLRYLTLLHYNYEGNLQTGEMIVHADDAENVLEIFQQLLSIQYEIYSIYLVDDFWTGDHESTDNASMAANNTSCFHYRAMTGGSSLSRHALGKAIDLNPLENPYVKVRDGVTTILPEAGAAYLDRESGAEHIITHQDPAYRIFTDYGYSWGGDWNSLKDYQHFEISE